MNIERIRSMAEISTNTLSFCIPLCCKGCGCVFTEDDVIRIYKGDCIFLPTNSSMQIYGRMELLDITC